MCIRDSHRAVNDAEATAEIFLKLVDMLEENDIENIDDINIFASRTVNYNKLKSHHTIILVKNLKMCIRDRNMSTQTAVYEEKMKKTLTALENEFATIRVGRANPKVLDKITVDYYGTPTPINQVGNITVPEALSLIHI